MCLRVHRTVLPLVFCVLIMSCYVWSLLILYLARKRIKISILDSFIVTKRNKQPGGGDKQVIPPPHCRLVGRPNGPTE